jgi:4-hydroxyphenylpyruvate dioxygenase
MKQKGIEFLTIPNSYYSDLPTRLKNFNENTQDLQKSQILLDRDEKGFLLQAFTKPVHVRPTLFFEIVQRKGAEGFGEGNVKALFEAVEKEQMKRELI